MPEVIMPKMGDAMEEGTLLKWLKSEGDDVSEGDPIAEIEVGFRAWFATGPADVGTQTRAVLSSSAPLAEVAAAAAARNPQGSGNGSLMRTGPVALAHPGDPAATPLIANRN